MHTVGQHKRLSLAREEGDPPKLGAGSDFGGSGSDLFRHKLSPGLVVFAVVFCCNSCIRMLCKRH